MADKLDWTFPGHAPMEIYEKLLERLGEVASRYALRIDSDPAAMSGRVHRPGADVKFHVKGEELHVHLDFSFIVPGAIRQRVRDELVKQVGSLFPA